MQLGDDLGHAEETDHGGDVGDAGRHLQAAEGQALLTRHRVQADAGNQRAQGAGKDALGERFARETAHQQDAPDRQQQVFARAEFQRQTGHGRRRNGERQDADEAAVDRDHRGQADGLTGLAALGQRVAIESGGNGRRCARDVQQDGAARATVHTAEVDARDQGQRVVHIPLEGERDQDRHRHRHRQAGDGADVDAGESARRGQQQHLPVQPGRQEVAQGFSHFRNSGRWGPTRLPAGSTTEKAERNTMKMAASTTRLITRLSPTRRLPSRYMDAARKM